MGGPRSAPDLRVRHVTVHGHRRAFVLAGHGPLVLLLHGIGSGLASWDRVLPDLARDHTVLAPDLLGHGRSDKPRGDYSLGGYANGMRDLLAVLDLGRATVVGHSFGGGVAMQFAYQYPQQCERAVLVGPGGLGREVSVLLRALSLPGAGVTLAAVRHGPLRLAAGAVVRLPPMPVPRLGSRLPGARALTGLAAAAHDLPELARVYLALGDPGSRQAFLRVLRAVVDVRGQLVTMLDRSYLAAGLPVLLVWGEADPVVPVRQSAAALAALPGARLHLVPGAGHFPHRDDPAGFCQAVREFIATTPASSPDVQEWRRLLRAAVPELASQRSPSGAA